VPEDVDAVGDDLAAEIEEAFALIHEHARLTPLGEAALAYFEELFSPDAGPLALRPTLRLSLTAFAAITNPAHS